MYGQNGLLKDVSFFTSLTDDQYDELASTASEVKFALKKLNGELDDGTEDLSDYNEGVKDLGDSSKETKKQVNETGDAVDDLSKKGPVTVKVNAETTEADDDLTDIEKKLVYIAQKSGINIKVDADIDDFKTKLKKVFGGPLKIMEKLLATTGLSMKTVLGSDMYKIYKEIFGAKGLVYYPKLAMGGIVNRPGTGVAYGGATIGERGAEAVVPLTDSQQMQLLGEAIGKYITVNANIVNTMNGRIISKELQRVQNESDFVLNR